MTGVYVVSARAVPSAPEASAEPLGAYINVYTTAATEAEARGVALREIFEAGWHCECVEGVSWHTREDYSGDTSGREYFEQALIDGVVLVMHTFPLNARH
jgi:hypothetical protein